jgi:DNA helicase-2/ATP-dependent DNA helicase PcrA
VLTFTRAAAAELRGRLTRDFGAEYAKVRVSTIHAFALRQLVRNDAAPTAPERVVIADDGDEADVIHPDLRRRIGERMGWTTVTGVRRGINEIAAGWANTTADAAGWAEAHRLAPLIGALREHRIVYAYALRAELVFRLYQQLRARPEFDLELFDHVLVDEYQDLTESELRVIRLMADRGALVYAGGDDDQAIYGWREATPEGIRRFEADYGPDTFVPLVECHRCDEVILDLAKRVISQDPARLDKELDALHRGGTFEAHGYPGHISEASAVARFVRKRLDAGVRPEAVLVLVRGSGELGRIANALAEARVQQASEIDPYGALRETEGRKVLLFLRLVSDEDEPLAWRQLMRASGFSEEVVLAYHDAALTRGSNFADLLGEVNRDPTSQALPRAEDVGQFVATTLDKISRIRDAALLDFVRPA